MYDKYVDVRCTTKTVFSKDIMIYLGFLHIGLLEPHSGYGLQGWMQVCWIGLAFQFYENGTPLLIHTLLLHVFTNVYYGILSCESKWASFGGKSMEISPQTSRNWISEIQQDNLSFSSSNVQIGLKYLIAMCVFFGRH